MAPSSPSSSSTVHRRRPSLISIVTTAPSSSLSLLSVSPTTASSSSVVEAHHPHAHPRRTGGGDKDKESDPDEYEGDTYNYPDGGAAAAGQSPTTATGRERTRMPTRRGTRKGSRGQSDLNSTQQQQQQEDDNDTRSHPHIPPPPGVTIQSPISLHGPSAASLPTSSSSSSDPYHPPRPLSPSSPNYHPTPSSSSSSSTHHLRPARKPPVARSPPATISSSQQHQSYYVPHSAPTSSPPTPPSLYPPSAMSSMASLQQFFLPPYTPNSAFQSSTDGPLLPLASHPSTPFHSAHPSPLPSPGTTESSRFFDSSSSPRSSSSVDDVDMPSEWKWKKALKSSGGGSSKDEKLLLSTSNAGGDKSLSSRSSTSWEKWWMNKKRKGSRSGRGGSSSRAYGTTGDGGSGGGAAGLGWKKLKAGGYIPQRKRSVCMSVILFVSFAWSLTAFLCWFLNPDKSPLPYWAYCRSPHPSYHVFTSTLSPHLQRIPLPAIDSSSITRHPLLPNPLLAPSAPEADLLPPVGLFLGVFSTDQAWERRQTIRSTYARRGKGGGADGLESVRVRFILGRPSEKWKSLVELEMEAYRDIVLLDIPENMNSGKTHAFFAWAAENAMVPSPNGGEKRPDYVSKADDDSFIMLGEMEKRLRVLGGVKVYWGYLIKNTFMGGECYALSLDLVRYVSSSQPVRSLIHGKEDKLVARWMRLHPEKEKILYVSERCWIYDHPKAGTVYAHGYLFPSTVTRMQEEHLLPPDEPEESLYGYYSSSSSSSSTNRTSAFTYSSVSQFGKTYRPPLPNLTPAQRVEALVEGSEMSLLSPYSSSPSSSPLPPEVVMARRPTMDQRYEGEWGAKWGKGTVVVHYLKEKEWFLETALAFLGSGNVGAGAGGEIDVVGGTTTWMRAAAAEIEAGRVGTGMGSSSSSNPNVLVSDHGGALRRDGGGVDIDGTPLVAIPVAGDHRINIEQQYPPEIEVRRLGDDV